MINSSAMRDLHRVAPVRIDYGRARQTYATGGLAKQAENVRQKGRMGDDMVVHVNKREFDEMVRRWGRPTINPHTQMPEFFLGDLFSGVGDLVSGGVGLVSDTAGDWLVDNPGVAQAIGSGLLGAGVGQLVGGNTKSTLIGAGLGALAPTVLGGASLFSGLSGAGGGARLADSDNVFKAVGSDLKDSGVSAAGAGAGSGSGLLGGLGSKQAMAGLIGALTLAQLVGGARASKPNAAQKQAQEGDRQAREQFNRPLPAMAFQRAYTPFAGDPRSYGFGGTQGGGGWFANNALPARVAPVQGQLARGGRVPRPRGALSSLPQAGASPRFVRGPGGARDDQIPALLSDNEYVIDAETTALLGDGDPEVGAKKLDAMRANIRKHKGRALAQGGISPNAKRAEAYIGSRR